MQAGRSTPFLRKGNDHADHYAGFGVEIAEHLSPAQGLRDAYAEVRRWYKWLAVLAANWPGDTEPRESKPVRELPVAPARGAAPSRTEWKTHPDAPHCIIVAAGRLVCEICLRFASAHTAQTYKALFARSACKGALQDLARTRAQLCRAARCIEEPQLQTGSSRPAVPERGGGGGEEVDPAAPEL